MDKGTEETDNAGGTGGTVNGAIGLAELVLTTMSPGVGTLGRVGAEAVKAIYTFLNTKKGLGNTVQVPMAEVGKETGFSYGTVYRAFEWMSRNGWITVDDATQPHTVHVNLPEISNAAEKSSDTAERLTRACSDLAQHNAEVMKQMALDVGKITLESRMLRHYIADMADWIALKEKLVDEIYSPQTGQLMLMFRQEVAPVKSFLGESKGQRK